MRKLYFHVEAIMDLAGVGLFERYGGPVESCIISTFDSIGKWWFEKEIIEINYKFCVLICQNSVLFDQYIDFFHTEILLLRDSTCQHMYRNKY